MFAGIKKVQTEANAHIFKGEVLGYTKCCMWAETGLHMWFTQREGCFFMVTVAHKDSLGSQCAHL